MRAAVSHAPVASQSPVLVTDAPSNASLAVVRSLGRRGIPVGVCVFTDEFNLAAFSRWATQAIAMPSPTRDASGFIDALARLLAQGKYPVVFPTTDRTIQLIAGARHRLPSWVRVPIPGTDALMTVLDKARTVELAERLEVRIPRTWRPASVAAANALALQLPYPVIVKPRQTNFLRADGQLMKRNYAVVTRPREFLATWRRLHEAIPAPIVQELVPGRGVGINTLWRDGEPLTWFCHRRVREIDPRGGRSSAAETAPCDPRLVDATRRMLAALRWHGVAMAEFKYDEPTGRHWLLEINGRFWGSLPLALAAGVDFPYHLYQLAVDEMPELPASYPSGVFARDAVAEIKHLVRAIALRHGAMAALRHAPTILHPWKASFNWTADDPEPGRREWLHTIGRALWRGQAA